MVDPDILEIATRKVLLKNPIDRIIMRQNPKMINANSWLVRCIASHIMVIYREMWWSRYQGDMG